MKRKETAADFDAIRCDMMTHPTSGNENPKPLTEHDLILLAGWFARRGYFGGFQLGTVDEDGEFRSGKRRANRLRKAK